MVGASRQAVWLVGADVRVRVCAHNGARLPLNAHHVRIRVCPLTLLACTVAAVRDAQSYTHAQKRAQR